MKRKFLPKFLALTTLACSAPMISTAVSCSCGGDTPEPVVKKLTIKLVDGNELPKSIEIGEEITLAAYAEGQRIDSGVSFTTDYETISINGNVVTGIAEGPAKIKCSVKGYEDGESDFNVNLKSMTIKLEDKSEIPPSLSINMSMKVSAFDKNGKPISNAEFSTDYPTIKIEGNVVTGIAEGPATIKCHAEGCADTETSSFNVIYKAIRIKMLSGDDVVNLPDLISVDDNITLVAVDQDGAEIKDAVFSTQDVSVINLVNNEVCGLSEGTAEIKCNAQDFPETNCYLGVVSAKKDDFITISNDEFRQEKTWRHGSDENKKKIETIFTGFKFSPSSTWTAQTWEADDITIETSVKDQNDTTFGSDWSCRLIKWQSLEDGTYTFDVLITGYSEVEFKKLFVNFDFIAEISDNEKYYQTIGLTKEDQLTIDLEEEQTLVEDTIKLPRVLNLTEEKAEEIVMLQDIVAVIFYVGEKADPNQQITLYGVDQQIWVSGPLVGAIVDRNESICIQVILRNFQYVQDGGKNLLYVI